MEAAQIKQIISRALVSFSGTTTGDGVAGGTTVVCSDLTARPDYDGQQLLIAEGTYAGQVRDIDGATDGGTVTVFPAFDGKIVEGINFHILTGLPTLAELNDIKGTGWTNENLTTIDALIDSILIDYLNHGVHGLSKIVALVNACGGVLNTLNGRTGSMMDDYLNDDVHGLPKLFNILNAIGLGVLKSQRHALSYWGQVSAVDGNTFTSDSISEPSLAGLGIDAMPGWWVYVVQADDAAPEGEYRLMTDYTHAGVVTHEAFTTALEVGDRVILLHPSIGMLGEVDTAAATGAVTDTDFMMAYIKQLVTELQVVDGLVDTAEAAGPYSYTDAGEEQDVVEDTAVTRRRIWLEFSNRNMTQTGTFKIYRKVDGSNYDLYVSQAVTVGAGDDRAWDAEFTTNQAWKLTYEEDENEGAAIDIPFNVITQVIE